MVVVRWCCLLSVAVAAFVYVFVVSVCWWCCACVLVFVDGCV